MPLRDDELEDAKSRLAAMLEDTIETFKLIAEFANDLFGENGEEMRAAITECLNDFYFNTTESGETHPNELIEKASREKLQRAGFYGVQLAVKDRQVTTANRRLRDNLRGLWKRPFKKWVDIINNFLGSLIGADIVSTALKELKDCLRDELPEHDE